jgi:RND superfamily putative drug exporter
VLVFLHGVGTDLFGFEQVDAIDAWVPLFLFSVLFGLSMDYQVFLLSRIRERYDRRGHARRRALGVASTARIITGAALIIVAVFLGFARGDLVMFQQMGFGVAVALLIDATIIRSVLLPSLMASSASGTGTSRAGSSGSPTWRSRGARPRRRPRTRVWRKSPRCRGALGVPRQGRRERS